MFQGRSDEGSLVEIRRKGDELLVEVDGSLLERLAAEKDLSVDEPSLRFRLNGTEFEESAAERRARTYLVHRGVLDQTSRGPSVLLREASRASSRT